MLATIPSMQKTEHGVQPVQFDAEPIERSSLEGLRWDDLKLFLHVADTASFRGAARVARVSINTVRSKVARLEDKLQVLLFRRQQGGVQMTPAGVRLRQVALAMRGAAVADGVTPSGYLRRPDELRIGASEGLGSGWLTPRLLELQSQFPELTMAMLCENDLEVDRSDDLDIGIVWQPPRNADLIVAKLATLHFMPFASRDYVREFGVPSTPEEMLNHRFIEQVAPGIKSGLLDQLVGTERPPGFLPIRTNSSLAVFWAVAQGVGIAFMPTYAAALVRSLVPIDLPFQIKFDIFYYYHPEARAAPPIVAGIEWLRASFDPQSFPWFRSAFVHPNDFRQRAHDNVIQLFEPLVNHDIG